VKPTGVHPAADVFPMLTDDDLDVLAADIKASGLRQPIVLDVDGLVLDGRNRLAACDRAGVDPTFVTFDGDAAMFVISANVHRRHMTTGQRAMATALVMHAAGKRRDGRWARGSVPADSSESGSWPKRMAEAGTVLDRRPDLAAKIVAGELPLSVAVDTLSPRQPTITIPETIDDARAVLEAHEVIIEHGLRKMKAIVDGIVAEHKVDRDAVLDYFESQDLPVRGWLERDGEGDPCLEVTASIDGQPAGPEETA
jgi:ParB/Sulfiredoxin domain